MRHALMGTVVLTLAASIAAAQWSDNFDSYATGSGLAGQGGWEIWYAAGSDGLVSGDHPASPPNCLRNTVGSDLVQRFNISSGKWVFKVKTYVASGTTGNGYVIMLNQYETPMDCWSLTVRFAGSEGLVENWFDYKTLPLIYDQWVELRADIDLDLDTLDIYYGGQPLSTGLVWSTGMQVCGIPVIACIDLYSETMDGMYYDDVWLKPPAAGAGDGDLNCDGVINAFDIDAFVKCLTTGTPTPPCPDCANADVNDDGAINAFDIDPFVVCLTTGNC